MTHCPGRGGLVLALGGVGGVRPEGGGQAEALSAWVGWVLAGLVFSDLN